MATILGTNRNDTLAAAAPGDTVYGLGGNDKITTSFPYTFLYGGAGGDRMTATGTGTISEYANNGDVQLSGDNGNDTLSTVISLSQETPEPGEPGQYYYYSVGTYQSGGSGDDELRSQSVISLETGQQNAGVSANFSLNGDDGNDRLWADSQLSSNATGYSSVNQYLSGGRGNDSLQAKAVANSTSTDSGANANLYLYGDDGADTLNADARLTSATSCNLDTSLSGGNGADTLSADARLTSATNGILYTRLSGDDGADQLTNSCTVDVGSSGNVYSDLVGGAGSDSIRAEGAVKAGAEGYLSAYVFGGDGNDAIDLDFRLDSPAGGGGAVVGGDNGDDTISVRLTTTSASSYASVEIYAGPGNDKLVGTIVGNAGGMNFDGGRGRDELVADNDGNNFLVGGAGSDRMTGGRGADTFGFGGYSGLGEMADGVRDRDVITNYSKLQGDTIDLPNGIDDVDSWKKVGANTELKLIADGDIIVLQGVIVTDLAADILFA